MDTNKVDSCWVRNLQNYDIVVSGLISAISSPKRFRFWLQIFFTFKKARIAIAYVNNMTLASSKFKTTGQFKQWQRARELWEDKETNSFIGRYKVDHPLLQYFRNSKAVRSLKVSYFCWPALLVAVDKPMVVLHPLHFTEKNPSSAQIRLNYNKLLSGINDANPHPDWNFCLCHCMGSTTQNIQRRREDRSPRIAESIPVTFANYYTAMELMVAQSLFHFLVITRKTYWRRCVCIISTF